MIGTRCRTQKSPVRFSLRPAGSGESARSMCVDRRAPSRKVILGVTFFGAAHWHLSDAARLGYVVTREAHAADQARTSVRKRWPVMSLRREGIDLMAMVKDDGGGARSISRGSAICCACS
jgi:hypothetical protein